MYNISRNGAEIGKYPKEEIVDGLMTGFFQPTDHCWKPGMTEWRLLSLEFAASANPAMSPPPPQRPDAAANPAQSLPRAPASQAPAPARSSAGRIGWLVGGFLMPYLFAWRIIFDRAYGFSVRTKVLYSVWMATFVIALATSGNTGSSRSERSQADYLAHRKANPYDVEGDQEKPEPYTWAITQAEALIRQRLKSPSSAKFSRYAETSRKKTYDDGVKQYYVVSGWVESQNSFGAMLRDDYLICFISTENSTKIGAKYLRIGEQSTGAIPIECKSMFSYPEEDAFFAERMKAAERGDMQAQYDVANCYAEAKGTRQNHAVAFSWYCKAAEQGHASAAFSLGLAHTTGSGVERNPSTAVSWYKKAAYGGHTFAQFVLANHYSAGNGTEKNLPEAYALLLISMGKLDSRTELMAHENLQLVKKEMTAEQVEAGRLRIVQLESIIAANSKK